MEEQSNSKELTRAKKDTPAQIVGLSSAMKKIIKKLIAWYIDPIVIEQQTITDALNEMIHNLNDNINNLNAKIARDEEAIEQQNRELASANDKEEELQSQIYRYVQRIEDIETREEWVRNRFEEHLIRIQDIETREEWTRGRFSEHEEKMSNQAKEIYELQRALEFQLDSNNSYVQETSFSFYNKKTYSQSGEDTITAYILNFLCIPMEEVSYLDLGANHARDMSNSYYFYQKGAKGVLVEANPELIEELEKYRRRDTILNRAVAVDDKEEIEFYSLSGDGLSTISYEAAQEACEINPDIYIKEKYTIKTIRINELLEKYFDKAPTILSIDLEGIEEEVLERINFVKYRPLVIIMENIPYRPYLVIEMKEDKMVEFMRKNGYIEYAFTGINSIYVDKKYIEKFNEEKKVNNM